MKRRARFSFSSLWDVPGGVGRLIAGCRRASRWNGARQRVGNAAGDDGDEGEDGECEGSRWLRRAPALPGPNDLFGLIDAILLMRLSHGARCDASIRLAARLVRDL